MATTGCVAGSPEESFVLQLLSLVRRGHQGEGVALVGIVLLAGGIAVLAASPIVLGRLLITVALWLAASVFLALART